MKELKSSIIKGIILVSVVGTLLHFAYEWSGSNSIVGIFAPINESIWEHTKLLFFPMTLYGVYVKHKIGTKSPCITSGMIIGSIVGIISIIALFYTYTGIIGFNVAVADISIFYISVLLASFTAYRATISCYGNKYTALLKMAQIAIILMYVVYTFSPPDIPLFENHG